MTPRMRKRLVSAGTMLVILGISGLLFYRAFHRERVDRELLAAVHDGNVAVARTALNSGADPNIRGLGMQIYDPSARSRSLLGLIRSLMTSPADRQPNLQPNRLPSALDLAERTGNADLVRLLLRSGADPNVRQPDGSTPLMAAAARGHTDIVNALLDRGADVNACTTAGWTPLIFALGSRRSYEIVETLLRHGASFRDGHGSAQTALAVLLENRQGVIDSNVGLYKAMIERLLAAGATAGGRDRDGKPMLVLVVKQVKNRGTLPGLQTLLAHGADVNAQTPSGETALMAAIRSGNIDLFRLLLAHGADVNRRESYGETALIDAIQLAGSSRPPLVSGTARQIPSALRRYHDALDSVRLLLAHGADVNARTQDGPSPLQLAIRSGDKALIQLLQQAGARH